MTCLTIYQIIFCSNGFLQLQDSNSVKSLVQQEINQTKIRFHPILNTWILAAVLIPTSTTLCVLVLVFKYRSKVNSVSSHIKTEQSMALAQMKDRILETQTLLNSVQSEIKISRENIQEIEDKIRSFQDKSSNH